MSDSVVTRTDDPYLVPTGDIQPLIDLGTSLQAKASEHGIHNVFDDGGYKELLLLTLFGLRKLDREGDDAADDLGRRYEIKTVARISSRGKRKTTLGITTEHTLTQANIDRYRRTFLWIIAVFDQERPEAIYEITPRDLEPFFAEWERRLKVMTDAGNELAHINNPKIPLKHVIAHGVRIWPPAPEVTLPPRVEQELLELTDLPPNLDPTEKPDSA